MGTTWNQLNDRIRNLSVIGIARIVVSLIVTMIMTILVFFQLTFLPESILLVQNEQVVPDFMYWLGLFSFRIALYTIPVILTFLLFRKKLLSVFRKIAYAISQIYFLYSFILVVLGSLYRLLGFDSFFAKSLFNWASSLEFIILLSFAIYIDIKNKINS
jgi:hypothetical protein